MANVTAVERFWSKVDKSAGQAGCWLWTGARFERGYGAFWLHGTNVRAHRFAWELTTGDSLGELLLDHRCHNPPCVNPRHLRPVTNKQNGENRRGAQCHSISGERGVRPNPHRKGTWIAQVWHNGADVRVGVFATISEAAEAARLKRLELFTHNDIDRSA